MAKPLARARTAMTWSPCSTGRPRFPRRSPDRLASFKPRRSLPLLRAGKPAWLPKGSDEPAGVEEPARVGGGERVDPGRGSSGHDRVVVPVVLPQAHPAVADAVDGGEGQHDDLTGGEGPGLG